MKKFLVQVHPAEDVDFLNITEIKFHFLDRLSDTDSGWCDVGSNAVLLRMNELLLFEANKEDELLLKIKFGNRITDYIEGIDNPAI
jgi:hypothetical protein